MVIHYNRDFKKLYDHGLRIAQQIGHPTEASTFNPVVVDFYQAVGYLPHAIVNYLLLLGWSLDDKTEQFSRDEMIEHFYGLWRRRFLLMVVDGAVDMNHSYIYS